MQRQKSFRLFDNRSVRIVTPDTTKRERVRTSSLKSGPAARETNLARLERGYLAEAN